MKRKGGAGGSQQPPLAKFLVPAGGGGSRFVRCPCCGRSVAAPTLDFHLNSCGMEPASAAATAGQAAAAAMEAEAAEGGARAQAATSPVAQMPLAVALPAVTTAACTPPSSPAKQQQQREELLGSSSRRPGKAPAAPLHDDRAAGAAAAAAAAEAAGPQQQSGGDSNGRPSGSASCWWQRRSAMVATGHRHGGGQVGLTADSLFAAAQCELVPSFLPAELADQLLQQLQADSPGWERMQWWIGGGGGGGGGGQEPGLSSKTNCHCLAGGGHELDIQESGQQQAMVVRPLVAEAPMASPDCAANPPDALLAAGSTTAQQHQQQQQQQAAAGVGAEGDGHAMAPAPESLRLAGDMVACHVSQRIQSGALARLPLEAADRQGWAPSYALANCYADGSSGVGAHSDRLTPLGPTPIIASLSLGATRTFRLHRQLWLELQGAGDGGGSSGAAAAAAMAAGVSRVDVQLPHNALCVMWPPCQEAWKHDVPKTSRPFPMHPTSGSTRYNLTSRRCKPQWEAQARLCRCGLPAVMKARQAQEAGNGGSGGGGAGGAQSLSYYYACDASKGPTCGFWQACPTRVVL